MPALGKLCLLPPGLISIWWCIESAHSHFSSLFSLLFLFFLSSLSHGLLYSTSCLQCGDNFTPCLNMSYRIFLLGMEKVRALPTSNLSFFFFFPINLFIYFWLRWVFVAARGLSLFVASRGYSSLWCVGFSLWWLLLLWSTGSRHAGFSSCDSRALERRLSSCGTQA